MPIVTGHVDWTALDRLTEVYLVTRGLRPYGPGWPGATDGTSSAAATKRAGLAADHGTPDQQGSLGGSAGPAGTDRRGSPGGTANCGCTCGGCTCPARTPLSPAILARLRQTMLRLAADVMSGPAGLASWLRTSQLADGPVGASPSLPLAVPLPLDIGEAEPAIPAHLRRAVLARHQHCTYPGCRVPAAFCQIHHYIPWSRGGRTAQGNLGPVCPFHHQTVVHRWGWTLTLHPDGEVTATSPDGTRVLRDHDPPSQAA